jgi:hypothetical protein
VKFHSTLGKPDSDHQLFTHEEHSEMGEPTQRKFERPRDVELVFITSFFLLLLLGRLGMDVDAAIEHYGDLAKHVFSHPKRGGGDEMFKASKLEEAMKSMVRNITGDSESLLLEGEDGVCRT